LSTSTFKQLLLPNITVTVFGFSPSEKEEGKLKINKNIFDVYEGINQEEIKHRSDSNQDKLILIN